MGREHAANSTRDGASEHEGDRVNSGAYAAQGNRVCEGHGACRGKWEVDRCMYVRPSWIKGNEAWGTGRTRRHCRKETKESGGTTRRIEIPSPIRSPPPLRPLRPPPRAAMAMQEGGNDGYRQVDRRSKSRPRIRIEEGRGGRSSRDEEARGSNEARGSQDSRNANERRNQEETSQRRYGTEEDIAQGKYGTVVNLNEDDQQKIWWGPLRPFNCSAVGECRRGDACGFLHMKEDGTMETEVEQERRFHAWQVRRGWTRRIGGR